MFSSAKFLNRKQNLQKRALRFLLDVHESTYEQVLNKTGGNSMGINRLTTLCVEICKILNKLNLRFVKNISTVKETEIWKPFQIIIWLLVKSLPIFEPKVWNKLPCHIKSNKNLKSFKELTKKLGWYTLQL